MAINKQVAGNKVEKDGKEGAKPFDESPGNNEWVNEFAENKDKVDNPPPICAEETAEGEDLDELDEIGELGDYIPESREDEIELEDSDEFESDGESELTDILEDFLIAFTALNPNPTDEQMGQLAGSLGMTKEELEYYVNSMFGHLMEEENQEGEIASSEEIAKVDP